MESADPQGAPLPNRRAFDLLRKIELTIAAAAVVLLVLVSLAIIILRMTTSTAWSVTAVDLLSQYPSHLMLVAALVGGSLALSRGETLKIEVLNGLMSRGNRVRVARAVGVIGSLFFIGFLALIVRYLMIDYRPIVAFVYLPLMLLIGVKFAVYGFTQKAD